METSSTEMLKKGKISVVLMKMSTPIIIAFIVSGLYNFVDAIFLGRGVGSLAIGALTLSYPIQMILIAMGLMISIGMASLVGRNLGAKNFSLANRTVGNAILLAVVFGVSVTILGILFLDPILIVLGATPNLLPFAREYLETVLLGSTFLFLTFVFNGAFRSEGKPQLAMLSTVFGALVNIILDPIFIFGFDMGVKGAAVATVIAQTSTFILCGYLFIRQEMIIKISLNTLTPEYKTLREILLLGLPILIDYVGVSIVVAFVNNLINIHFKSQSDIHISAYGLYIRFFMFATLPIFGLMNGYQSIVSYNYGANQMSRVKEVTKIAAGVVTAYLLFLLFSLLLFSELIMGVFTTDTELIKIASTISIIIFSAFPLQVTMYVAFSFFLAIGNKGIFIVLSFARMYFFPIPALLVFPRLMGSNGIWYSYPIADTVSAFFAAVILIYGIKKLKHTPVQSKLVVQE